MIIVTGGAGFIGSNLVHELNRRGRDDVIVVDDLSDGRKFVNIGAARIADYLDVEEFRAGFLADRDFGPRVDQIFHLGACSTTTEWDGRKMLDLNYAYSRDLIKYAVNRKIPVVYASSAAIYGGSTRFTETPECESPLNVYAYSKYLLDTFVRRLGNSSQRVTGLRYFNVYGPREQHKGAMASVVYHFNKQLHDVGKVRLFEGSHGLKAGEQRRDFIYVDDAVAITLWFGEHATSSAIYNCGTGRAQTFNDVAQAVLAWHGHGEIEYIPFPDDLLVAYQSDTQADLSALRAVGCEHHSRAVGEGVRDYLDWLND